MYITVGDVMHALTSRILCLLVDRLETVRREAAAAEERAQQLAAEVRGATEALNARTDAYNQAVGDFFRCAPASMLVAACLRLPVQAAHCCQARYFATGCMAG